MVACSVAIKKWNNIICLLWLSMCAAYQVFTHLWCEREKRDIKPPKSKNHQKHLTRSRILRVIRLKDTTRFMISTNY